MSKEFFQNFGLTTTKPSDLEIGSTYPIYGMITKIISDKPDNVVVELNFSIECRMNITDSDKIETLKTRSFEPGIFISEIIENADKLKVDCVTVVYGKREENYT